MYKNVFIVSPKPSQRHSLNVHPIQSFIHLFSRSFAVRLFIHSLHPFFRSSISYDQIYTATVTDETLMAEVECILNDRALTPVTNSSLDPEPLTPNKFLLLNKISSISLDEVVERDLFKKRWRTVQCLANTFWKRLIREYIPTL